MSYRTFVSSTYLDLKDHRARIIQQLRKSGFDVDPMEDWTSDADEPARFSQDRVRNCDLCILLVAFRRGSVPEGQERSITQMEFEYARKHSIDVLPFVLDDAVTDWPPAFDQRETDDKLKSWRREILKRHGVETFKTDPTSLDVTPALHRWKDRRHEREQLRDYLDSVRKAHGDIKFLGLPQLKDNRDIRIDRLFVDPFLSAQYLSPDRSPEDWPAAVPLFDAVADQPRLVVLGDPGCGKSTLVNWIAWQLAQERPNDWTKRLDRRIPLPLIVRDLGIRPGITWDALLDTFLGLPVGKHLAKDHLVRLLEDGAVFVLLDGLDEIGNRAARRDLRDAVQDGMQRCDKCRWLFTSRIVGYEDVPFHLAPRSESARMRRRMNELLSAPNALASVQHVAPFDDEQIVRFAEHWYAEREADPVRAKEGARNLVDAVHADPATTRLARIPNLLTIMALIHRIRARLPNGKALLYNEIAQAYLETIDDYRKLRETNDTLADKKRWLARVGFEMQLQRSEASSRKRAQEADREVLVPGDRLRAWLAEGMQASGRHVDEDDPARFIDHIKRRSGLMIERSDGQYAFTHLSFQEYFAACYLRERITSPGWILKKNIAPGTSATDLKQYAGNDIWREALVFLFELIAHEVPDWKETLWEGVFGPDWQSVASTGLDQRATVCLLARLAVDPHAGLDEVLREQAVQCCLQWELERQNAEGPQVTRGPKDPPEVLRILLSVDPHDQIHYLERLADGAQAANIRHLDLSRTGVTDLGPLKRLTGLRRLDLSYTGVTDLGPLERLTGLQTLNLYNTGVTDLGPLERLTGLQELILPGTGVTDLGPLERLTGLRLLDLRDTDVTDLGPLERLTGLQWLDLRGTGVTDLGPLERLTGLRLLDLRGTDVTDLGPLERLTGLKTLDLRGTGVTDLGPLERLTGLQELDLRGTGVTAEQVTKLQSALPETEIIR